MISLLFSCSSSQEMRRLTELVLSLLEFNGEPGAADLILR